MKCSILLIFGILFSFLTWAQVPTNNLTAEYKFKNGSLTDRISGADLVHTGTALTGTPDRANGVNTDRAISLNGDHLQRTVGTTGNSFSISFWIKTSINDVTKRVIIDQSERANEAEGASETGWYVYLLDGKIGLSGNFQWYHNNNTVNGTLGYIGWHTVSPTTVIADGNWHHVTITNEAYAGSWYNAPYQRYDRIVQNTYKIYIDNALSATQGFVKNLGQVTGQQMRRFITATTPITIGNSRAGNSTNRFTDAIDDIRYYTAVLPASDVTLLYNEVGCAGVTGITMLAQNFEVTLDAAGNATITPEDIDNGSINSCNEPVTLSLSQTSFTCDHVGENTVTLYAEDEDGNQANTTATVTVKPLLSVPPVNFIVYSYLDASGNGTLSPDDINNGTTYSCDTDLLTKTLSKTVFTCSDLGVNTNATLTVSDDYGNLINRAVVVTAEDTIPPTAIAQNIIVQLDLTGSATITPEMIDNGSSDNCTVSSLSLSKTQFSCADAGENSVTLTVTDFRSNTSTATATVTVVSIINDETVSTPNASFCTDGSTGGTISTGSSAIGVDYYLRNSADNSIVDGPLAGTGSALEFNTGNLSQTTTFNVFAEKALQATLANALEFDGVNDKVEIPFVNQLISTSAFTIEAWINPTKTSAGRIVTRFNGASNTAGDVVFDTYAPLNNGRGLRLYLVNSGGTAIQHSVDNVLTLNTWSHVAATFNAGTIKLYVNGIQVMTQNIAMTTVVSANTSWIVGEDRGGTVGEFFAGKMDEVRFWNVARTGSEIQANMNACILAGTPGLTAHYKFDQDAGTSLTDNTGNANTGNLINMDASTDWVVGMAEACQQSCGFQLSTEITIGDTTPPTAAAQNITLQLDGTGTATLTPSAVDGGSSDNCTASQDLVLSVDKATFTCDDIGENTVTLTVSDAAGNETTTTATITVEDNVAPSAITQNLTLQLDASGNAVLSASDVNNGSADNCTAQQDLVLSIDKTAFTCIDLGENTVTLTVTDASGNEATATATISVVDEVLPMAVTQNVTLQLDGSGNATLTPSAIDNGSSDNCSTVTLSLDKTTFSCTDLGVNTVMLTVTDASNNQAMAMATVTVEDTATPTVLTKNITVYLGMDGVANISAAEINDGSSDNCTAMGSLSMSLDVSSFTQTHVGANTVTLTVVDAQGNSGTATATVTVEDRLEQTIAFDALAQKTFGDAAFELTSTASSGLTVSYSSSNESVATINGSIVTIIGAGTTTIIASQAGDEDFQAAPPREQILVVNKADQVITFAPLTSVNFTSGNLTLTATSSIGLPVSFASSDENIATVSGTTLTFGTPGLVEITASQTGNANYNAAAPVVVAITITDDRQTISLSGSLNFGNVLQGETDQKTVIITNSGNSALEISSITLPDGFTASANTTSVSANSTLSVTITFAPTELKTYDGFMVVTSNAVSGTNEIAVSGTGATITGFNEPNQPIAQLDVYPNPGTGVFMVKGRISKGRQVAITGASGQLYQRAVRFQDEDTHMLDITDLPAGVYYLKVEEKGSVAVKRIVKLN